MADLTKRTVIVRGSGDYRVEVSDSASGTLVRLDNFFKGMESDLRALHERLSSCQAETEAANAELSKPFEHTQTILNMAAELEKINAELNLDKTEIEPVIDDAKFQDEAKAESGCGCGEMWGSGAYAPESGADLERESGYAM